jgi:hypothetical protein
MDFKKWFMSPLNWGMSLVGIFLLFYVPPRPQYHYLAPLYIAACSLVGAWWTKGGFWVVAFFVCIAAFMLYLAVMWPR